MHLRAISHCDCDGGMKERWSMYHNFERKKWRAANCSTCPSSLSDECTECRCGNGTLFRDAWRLAKRHHHCPFLNKHHTRQVQWHNVVMADIFRSSSPMRAISGVLESPWAALSIRGIMSLFGRLFTDRLGQKWVYKAPSSARFGLTATISNEPSEFDQNNTN